MFSLCYVLFFLLNLFTKIIIYLVIEEEEENVFKTLQKTQATGKSKREWEGNIKTQNSQFLFVPFLNEIFSVSLLFLLHHLSQFFFKIFFFKNFFKTFFQRVVVFVCVYETLLNVFERLTRFCFCVTQCFHSRRPIIITFYIPSYKDPQKQQKSRNFSLVNC